MDSNWKSVNYIIIEITLSPLVNDTIWYRKHFLMILWFFPKTEVEKSKTNKKQGKGNPFLFVDLTE